ncbi:MAG: FAD-dependent oxidoreductase [Verrucomicrobiota bacterium]
MSEQSHVFFEEHHKVDFCVVGGGMAGLTAAIAAARNGARTVLIHDRPVLGGNASSECRVHVRGAERGNKIPHMRETGILEELRLENLYRNPQRSFSMWDLVLYEKARLQEHLTVLLNCSCFDAVVEDGRIQVVKGWQLTTQIVHTVEAEYFADCSGDAVLAPLTGAEYRVGRESSREFDESIAPAEADNRTMGMTCLFQTREHDHPQPFEPPEWAETYEKCEDIPGSAKHKKWWKMGYWWIELGGDENSGIENTEETRDALLRILFGVWDHIKNRCTESEQAANWALDWVQFLPGKRESRRYVGDKILTQGDIEDEGRFEDTVAYGGWAMDDHHWAGFRCVALGEPPTVYYPTPSPYGIPYRTLYSRNIDNLFVAGRVASCTHAAFSSTRVMGTGCSQGQAVGTAAALACREHLSSPSDVGQNIERLQQLLLQQDCYLPRVPLRLPALVTESALESSRGDPEPVRDGWNRQIDEDPHAWSAGINDWIAYRFASQTCIERVILTLDSGMDQDIQLSYHALYPQQLNSPPEVMPKAFRVEGYANGEWCEIYQDTNNHQRHIDIPVHQEFEAVSFVLEQTWGAEASRIYQFYVLPEDEKQRQPS